MAAGLKGSSDPRLGTITAFIFMSPLLNPVTLILTWVMLGWSIAVARIIASVAGSFLLGLLVNRLEHRLNGKPKPASADACEPNACAL